MSDIFVQCPKCSRSYVVSPIQLSLSHGQVCCTGCQFKFNAYDYLSLKNMNQVLPVKSDTILATPQLNSPASHNAALKIFDRTIAASNIDFKTYLNNAKAVDIEPPFFDQASTEQLHVKELPLNQRQPKPIMPFVYMWLGTLLFVVLILQFIERSENLHSTLPFTQHTLTTTIMSTEQDEPNLLRITGQISNSAQMAQLYPNLNIIVKAQNAKEQQFVFKPDEYLPLHLIAQQKIQPQQELLFQIELPIQSSSSQSIRIESKYAK
ncbi:DUF3426 domain-containing protein [Acinetobacter sp. MD2(2019)]|uniref:DUF3426 domain-containing protein n=1 Tax=Acinetobacter sp. MD2(2019) TaxID=2605273 RepID=UPI002D1F4A55|nr:DUF3426 domain-containing protein [Acinetobacter sp. MD2(2019)]MEB3753512.1 hypothetical protein [Acinetobacter sp. MD2(2019)]